MSAKNGKHIWKKDESFENIGIFKKKHICKTCGCEKLSSPFGPFYIRNKIKYGDKRPECLDWNDNTLD